MMYCFGDSWGYGSELDLTREKPFINLISESIEIPFINLSKAGASLGAITYEILNYDNFKKNDFIIIIIPPDCRWYYESIDNLISSLWITDMKKEFDDIRKSELSNYLTTLTHRKVWYQYHQSLFLFTLQEFFKTIEVEFLFAHNYGKIQLFNSFNHLISKENFVNFERSLTALLTNNEDLDLLEQKMDGPIKKMFFGPYFEGNGTHPNQIGHNKIKEIIIDNPKFNRWFQLITNGENLKKLL